MDDQPTISILGCGWFGLALAKELIIDGYRVKGSTTTEQKLPRLRAENIDAYLVDFEVGNIRSNSAFFDSDILIVSIPPKGKSPDVVYYSAKIDEIAEAAVSASVKQLIFISSTGVFQDGIIADEHVNPLPTSDAGKVILKSENLLRANPNFTTTIIRFAGLIGPERNLAKHFAGKKAIANGLAPINLIHLQDCIGITKAIIAKQAFGKIYHGVMASHPSRAQFYTQLCKATGLELPTFVKECSAWKQIESDNVVKLLNYTFKKDANKFEL